MPLLPLDDAAVRRRDFHGPEARGETRTAGILAEERPHLPRRAVLEKPPKSRIPKRYTERLMNAVQRSCASTDSRGNRIFDNSNLQGAHPVASCVVFRDGKPSRKEYRHFNIKTVTGADDYAPRCGKSSSGVIRG